MRRMSAARREAGIEITPLIDVVFLLLIFFMVSSSFVQKQVISVTLPESGAAVANVSDTVEISLDAAGMYFVDGQPVDADLTAMATRYVTAVREEQSEGPYELAGCQQICHTDEGIDP